MRMVYGNYLAASGAILVGGAGRRHAPSRARSSRCGAQTLGYVSQFLRVVPRVPTLDVVAEPLLALGTPAAEAPRPRARRCSRG